MSGWTARIRAGAGPLALLAALALAAGVLVVGTPRAVNELTDVGLRHDISQLAYTARDLTFRGEKADDADWGPQQRLQEQQAALQPALRDRIVQSWWAASTQLEKSPVRGPACPRARSGTPRRCSPSAVAAGWRNGSTWWTAVSRRPRPAGRSRSC
ncbi:hypothetical protein ACFQZ4_43400 [Catellatospora coxensis]